MSGCPHWPEIPPGAKACPSPTADKSWLIRSPESVTPSLFLVPIFLGLCHQDSLPGHHLTPSQTSAHSLTTPTLVTSQVTLLASALNPSVIAGPPGLCCPNSSRQKWLLPPHLTAVSSFTFPPSQNTPFTWSAKHWFQTNPEDIKKQKILRRGGKNTQNYTKKIFMTQVITMVWSLT